MWSGGCESDSEYVWAVEAGVWSSRGGRSVEAGSRCRLMEAGVRESDGGFG